jgi:uncharacterized membrane protein YfcA
MLGTGAAIVLLGKWLTVSTLPAVALAATFPFALFVFGFYLATERTQMAALVRRLLRMQTT